MIQRGKLIEWYLSSERELRVIFTSQKCNFCPFCVMNFFDEYEILQVCVNFYFAFFDNFQFRNHEISWNCRWWRFWSTSKTKCSRNRTSVDQFRRTSWLEILYELQFCFDIVRYLVLVCVLQLSEFHKIQTIDMAHLITKDMIVFIFEDVHMHWYGFSWILPTHWSLL